MKFHALTYAQDQLSKPQTSEWFYLLNNHEATTVTNKVSHKSPAAAIGKALLITFIVMVTTVCLALFYVLVDF